MRAITEQFRCCPSYRRPASWDPALESLVLRFYDGQDRLVLVLHCYLRPTGDLNASGFFDPKFLRDDTGTCYRAP